MTIATSADRTRIVYHSDGSTPGTNTTFAFCDAKRTHSTGTIILSNSGRARQGNATAEQDAVCAQ